MLEITKPRHIRNTEDKEKILQTLGMEGSDFKSEGHHQTLKGNQEAKEQHLQMLKEYHC